MREFVIGAATRAPHLSAVLHRAVLAPAHAQLTSVLLASAPDELDAAAGSSDATPYVAVYISLVLALAGGIGYLVYQDLEAGRRKREAVESRAEMAEKLRKQGMEREARILDREREQLQEQIENAKLTPVWEQAAKPGRARAEAEKQRNEAPVRNRDDRRAAMLAERRQERKAKKAKKGPPAPPAP